MLQFGEYVGSAFRQALGSRCASGFDGCVVQCVGSLGRVGDNVGEVVKVVSKFGAWLTVDDGVVTVAL
jgi:hypothetical protein